MFNVNTRKEYRIGEYQSNAVNEHVPHRHTCTHGKTYALLQRSTALISGLFRIM